MSSKSEHPFTTKKKNTFLCYDPFNRINESQQQNETKEKRISVGNLWVMK